MLSDEIKIKYIGGPTILLQVGGVTFITDPTFDPRKTSYPTAIYTLHKTQSPAISMEGIEADFVLLSHDHHYDNLDNAGRAFLSQTKRVYTTAEGAGRLGGNAVALRNWETVEIALPDQRVLCITGTPCRHGPVGGDRGPVSGFLLNYKGEDAGAVYITGDTVWYEGVLEVAKKFNVGLVILFLGAAIVKEVGDSRLTMNARDGIKVAETFSSARIMPLHFEGWKHYTESKEEIKKVFQVAGLINRLDWAEPLRR